MTGTYKNKRQKGVDILLAVDMMNHAVRQNMVSAILLSGDGDFQPLVEAVVQMGLFVTLAGDINHTSRELAVAADDYRPLRLTDYWEWTLRYTWKTAPFPQETGGGLTNYTSLKHGVMGGIPCELLQGGNLFVIAIHREGRDNATYITLDNLDRLLLYCELQYGSFKWD
jgi:hypothetical protein